MIVEVVDGSVTRELRRQVLRPSWAVGTPMHGDDEPHAVHVAALAQDATVLGACVLIRRPCPVRPEVSSAWQLRGMATADALRGTGVGAAVLDFAVQQVRARGARLLWCEARESARGFYARHGFTAEGELFPHAETGIAHQLMWRELPAPPTSSSR